MNVRFYIWKTTIWTENWVPIMGHKPTTFSFLPNLPTKPSSVLYWVYVTVVSCALHCCYHGGKLDFARYLLLKVCIILIHTNSWKYVSIFKRNYTHMLSTCLIFIDDFFLLNSCLYICGRTYNEV